jgi:hypothetical protein
MAMKDKRIPNSYNTSKEIRRYEVEHESLMVMDDQNFVDCVIGRKDELSLATKQRIIKSMRSYKAKMEIFLAAYAQKNANRLSRVLKAMDSVDKELFQDWRLRTMDGETLAKLLGDLIGEKSRLAMEIAKITDRFSVKDIPDLNKLELGTEDSEEAEDATFVEVGDKVKKLSLSSRKKVSDFLKKVQVPRLKEDD